MADDATGAARRLAATARVARLATVQPSGRVDLVPITFAFAGERLVTAVDHKPKSTTRLARLANVAANPDVTVLFDHYEDDWTALWWVRLHGRAQVVDAGPDHTAAVEALAARYDQYVGRPPTGAAILVEPTAWRLWRASDG